METSFEDLEKKILCCTRCPRLVEYRKSAPARACFQNEHFWRKPVPGFGDTEAFLLILGLAPAAQGGNRTGRVFTGDASGVFLMKALYEVGLANQPQSEFRGDNLRLKGCFITASVKCVPPLNKPLPQEFRNCSSYFENEFFLLKNLKAVLALGKHAFDTYLAFIQRNEGVIKKIPFAHGAIFESKRWPKLYGSYHPSPQNTQTGKLTESMFKSLLTKILTETPSENL